MFVSHSSRSSANKNLAPMSKTCTEKVKHCVFAVNNTESNLSKPQYSQSMENIRVEANREFIKLWYHSFVFMNYNPVDSVSVLPPSGVGSLHGTIGWVSMVQSTIIATTNSIQSDLMKCLSTFMKYSLTSE